MLKYLLQWAIQVNHPELFLPFDGANTNKGCVTSGAPAIDPLRSFLRYEYHTLTCLPKTGVIVFAVRIYLTPRVEIKAEGLGPQLAEACESMPEKFGVCKTRPMWGDALSFWLRHDDTLHTVNSCTVSDSTPLIS